MLLIIPIFVLVVATASFFPIIEVMLKLSHLPPTSHTAVLASLSRASKQGIGKIRDHCEMAKLAASYKCCSMYYLEHIGREEQILYWAKDGTHVFDFRGAATGLLSRFRRFRCVTIRRQVANLIWTRVGATNERIRQEK